MITLLRYFRQGKCSGYKSKLKKVVYRSFCKIIGIIHERLADVWVLQLLVIFIIYSFYVSYRELCYLYNEKSYFQINTVLAVLWHVIRFQSLNDNAFVKNHKSVSNHEFLFLLLSILLQIFSSNLSFLFKFECFSLCMLSHLDSVHGLQPSSSCPWNFPGKNTGMGCHFPLQGIFLTQG